MPVAVRRLGGVTLAVAVLASCGGGGHRGGRTLATVAPSAPVTPGPASPPPSIGVVTTAPAVAADERCRGSSTAVSHVDTRAALGHSLDVFAVRNTSGRPCRVEGYPTVELLDAGGTVLASGQRHPGYILGPAAPAPLTVPAGGAAYFGVESQSICPDDQPSADSVRVRVVLPDQTEPVVAAAAVPVCPVPDIAVSPLRPSAAAVSAG